MIDPVSQIRGHESALASSIFQIVLVPLIPGDWNGEEVIGTLSRGGWVGRILIDKLEELAPGHVSQT